MRRNMYLVALAAVAALASGCGDTPETGEGAEDKLGGQASVSPSSLPEDPAVTAYVAMWEDTAVASHTSDAEHPRLDDHSMGEALALLKSIMEEDARDGHVAGGGPKHDVTVVESSADHRELRDCMDQTDWLMYKENGELVDSVPGSHRVVEATVKRHGGEWMVTDLLLHAAGTC